MIKESMIFNELIHEQSPYLMQYIDNPIQWNKWCENTFSKAKIEGKPIFVLLGHFLCKKCYHMKRECFLDIEVAKTLNENFISINVDKDEKPAIYMIYTEICKAIKHDIKLPYIMIMTHNKEVFFAESDLPKLENENKVGLLDVLKRIAIKWNEDKEQFTNLAKEITISVKESLNSYEQAAKLSKDALDKAICIYKYFFWQWKVNKMDKFVQIPPQNMLFLVSYYKQSQDKEILNMLKMLTQNIYKSVVYDHIGYGFFEYIDNKLSLTKTLYNNTLMAATYMDMFYLTKEDEYKKIATQTLQYILTNLSTKDGGFISKVAGNTKEKEDEYYRLLPFEIVQILGDVEGDEFNNYFNLKRGEDGYIKDLPTLSNTSATIDNLWQKILKVREYRRERSALIKDDRIFTSENALLIAALARAYITLKDEQYLSIAKRTLDYIEKNLMKGNNIYINQLQEEGTINEYANIALAYLELYKTTFKKEYLDKSYYFSKNMIDMFGKKDEAGLYFSKTTTSDIIFNIKAYKDDEKISGNSIATYVFYELGTILKDIYLIELSKKQIQGIMDNIYQEPLKYTMYLTVLCML